MALELPALPYAYDALQPYMSKETLEFHHDKHHQAYVTNGNNLLKGSSLAKETLSKIVKANDYFVPLLINGRVYISGSG